MLVWGLAVAHVDPFENQFLQSFPIHGESSTKIDARCPSPLGLHKVVAHKHGVVAIVDCSVDVALEMQATPIAPEIRQDSTLRAIIAASGVGARAPRVRFELHMAALLQGCSVPPCRP
eukprot:2635433-Pyramimonas_sp.AAC.1